VKPTSSETTGTPSEELPQGENPTGMQRGVIGYETPLTIANADTAGQWLATKTPEEADKAMASLVRTFGVKLDDEARVTYPQDGGFRREVVAIHAKGKPLTAEQLSRVDGFFAPANERVIGQWIAELSVISARRADDDMSETLRLHAYTRRLSEYPADVVKMALLDKTWRFFPTWAELHEVLEPAMKRRRMLRQSVQNVKPAEPAKVIKLPVYDEPPKERGPRPFIPEPKAPQPNVEHLREELELLKADKELSATEHGQAYAQSLIERIAQAEARKPTTQEGKWRATRLGYAKADGNGGWYLNFDALPVTNKDGDVTVKAQVPRGKDELPTSPQRQSAPDIDDEIGF
jgi:hypothetical protein